MLSRLKAPPDSNIFVSARPNIRPSDMKPEESAIPCLSSHNNSPKGPVLRPLRLFLFDSVYLYVHPEE